MTRSGKLLADHSVATLTHRSPSDHRIFEQSTADIWSALAQCSKAVLAATGVAPERVKGVGYDATCSLAVVDANGEPVSISRTGAKEEQEGDKGEGEGAESDANLGLPGRWNVILWADHRAEEEAEVINATEEGVLGFVGETMSVRSPFYCWVGAYVWRKADTSKLEMEIPKTLWLKKHMAEDRFNGCQLFE